MFNQKFGSKEPPRELQIPPNFKELMGQKSSLNEKKTPGLKTVVLNLDQYYEESKYDELEWYEKTYTNLTLFQSQLDKSK